MTSFDYYFRRFGAFPEFISEAPAPNLGIVIVIPCYNEPQILCTLQSLDNCSRPSVHTEVIIVLNSAESCSAEVLKQNNISAGEIQTWCKNKNSEDLKFHLIHLANLPSKTAGVGLARKAGMDEALRRFSRTGKSDGIIAGFDADSTCDANYLIEINHQFRKYPDTSGCSVYFEHPVIGNDYPSEVYSSIIQYELYLRYYKQALHYIRFPFAYHTIGSCFAVSAQTYVQQGGMNKRKAGEDFYFLQKVIPQGNFHELNSTRVIPSPRPSDRVPFGTGAAIKEMITYRAGTEYMTYTPESFFDLIPVFTEPEQFYHGTGNLTDLARKIAAPHVAAFLEMKNFEKDMKEIKSNCSSAKIFRKKFFQWFNAFRVLKYLNDVHDSIYQKQPVSDAAQTLLKKINVAFPFTSDKNKLLEIYRKLDRGN